MKHQYVTRAVIAGIFFGLFPGYTLNAQQASEELINLLLRKNIIGQSEVDSIHAKSERLTDDKGKPKRGGRIWGLTYTDAMYKAHADSARRGNAQYSGLPKDSSALDFRRIYLGYDYIVNERFSAEFILAHESATDVLQSGNRAVFVKAANLRWRNIYPLADLVAGLSSTPTVFFFSEKAWGGTSAWGYRSVERTITDMRKLGSTSDAGISIQGRFNTQGSFGYNLMVGNGSGARPENDKFKKMYGNIYAKSLNQRLIVDLYGDYERSKLTPKQQGKATFKMLVAYNTPRFAAGLEVVEQFQQNNTIYTEPKPDNPSQPGIKKDTVVTLALGISGFVRGSLIKEKLAFFLRYDYFNPDLNFLKTSFYGSSYTGNTVQHFITAGLDYSAASTVHIIPNIWYDEFDARGDAANKVHTGSLLQRDYDLVYRVTLYYLFR